MKAAWFVLFVTIAIVGPIWLPIVLLKRCKPGNGLATFGVTNLITALPMIGMVLWAFYFPGPRCREINPDAPCDSYDAAPGWMIFALIFGVLALWGVIASLVTTVWTVKRRKGPRT